MKRDLTLHRGGEPMKILFANTLYPPNIGGGAEVALADMVTAFRARGHQCTVLATHGGKGVLREEVQGAPVLRIGHRNVYWGFPLAAHSAPARTAWHAIDGYNPAMAHEAGKMMDEVAPDVLVCHNLAGLSVAAWAQAKKRNLPIVQVLHDYYLQCPKSTMFRDGKCCTQRCGSCGLFRLPHRAASENVDAVVGVSEAVLQAHLRNGLFSHARIKAVVHNARALPAPKQLAAPTRPFTFGYLGALTEIKGVELLAKAFDRVASRDARPMRLVIAGQGKEEDVARLQREYASERVSFVGHVKPSEFFAKIDVAVVPSLWNEPLGLVVFEALAAGVPVIGSRRGGIPEMIRHRRNGLLFEPTEAGSLESAMLLLMADDALRASMRSVGRASVATFLDPDRMIDQYETIFRDTIAQPNGRT
jgi:glycosyltransferase involved in cell wall biosynthesis